MKISFIQWQEYFRSNVRQQGEINWDDKYELTDEEYDAIAASIQIFQKGESSEARQLLRKIHDFSTSENNISYYHAFDLFIQEEHRHSRELGLFMSQQKIPKISSHSVDNIFIALRRLGPVEMTISVLVSAEIIASVYYKALAAATNSEQLKQLCGKILDDEAEHINFQASGLAQFYSKRTSLSNSCISLLKRIFLEGTMMVVWAGHYPVLKRGGYNYTVFRSNCLEEFKRCENLIWRHVERKAPGLVTAALNWFC